MTELKRCKESFVFFHNNVPYTVSAGDIVEVTDVLYTSNRACFEDVKVTRSIAVLEASSAASSISIVETATAVPGEKREVSATRFTRKSDA